MKNTQKQVKEVTTLARFEFKNDPRKVCYLVESSNGKDQYTTCLFNGKACSCTCPATKPCYHMIGCEAKEASRKAAPVAEAEAFIAKVQAEKAALHNSNEGHFEMRGERLIPMR